MSWTRKTVSDEDMHAVKIGAEKLVFNRCLSVEQIDMSGANITRLPH